MSEKANMTTIAGGSGHNVPVCCWPCDVPGLVVTAIPVTENEEGYRVTHQESGKAIAKGPLPTIPIAKLFASKVAQLTDWTLKDTDFQNPATISAKLEKTEAEFLQQLLDDPSSIMEEALDVSEH